MKMNQEGFTIIELLIATVVFTAILTLTATTIIGISQTYIKGSISNQTQQTARAIVSDISQAIQFNDISQISQTNTVSGNNDEFWFCIGSDVYVYTLDKYLTTSAPTQATSNWVLRRYNDGGGSCPSSPTPTTTGSQEYLSANERLGELYIEHTMDTNVYTINVEVAYGQNDLLNDGPLSRLDNNPAIYNGTSPVAYNTPFTYQCETGLDSSFCAVTTLSTTIEPRVDK